MRHSRSKSFIIETNKVVSSGSSHSSSLRPMTSRASSIGTLVNRDLSSLTHVKGKHKNADKGIVHQIPCGDCDKPYIGETGRPFAVRMKEHQRAVKHEDMKNANAVHSIQKSHSIDWDNARIIDREQKWKKRRIKESLYIRMKENYNLDSGITLSHVWDPLIGQALCISNQD